MDIRSIYQKAEEQKLRAERFSRSAGDIRAEIAKLKKEVAEQQRREILWARQATASPVPTAGASALARTLWDNHRLKNLIKALEHDLQKVEGQGKVASEKAFVLHNLARSAAGGNTYALHQADTVTSA